VTVVGDWLTSSGAGAYLAVPRSIMEAMPADWQERMVEVLRELDVAYTWRPPEGSGVRYWCMLKNAQGRIVHDPLMAYINPDRAHIAALKARRHD
jgi:hypothetical protein